MAGCLARLPDSEPRDNESSPQEEDQSSSQNSNQSPSQEDEAVADEVPDDFKFGVSISDVSSENLEISGDPVDPHPRKGTGEIKLVVANHGDCPVRPIEGDDFLPSELFLTSSNDEALVLTRETPADEIEGILPNESVSVIYTVVFAHWFMGRTFQTDHTLNYYYDEEKLSTTFSIAVSPASE